MAQIPSTKPDKVCRYCGKTVKNLGWHISNQHPKILEQLEETKPNPPQTPSYSIPSSQQEIKGSVGGSINDMIKEKLDTMLNIKIIEMLSKGASIKDIKEITDPTPKQTFGLAELKEYHDLVFKDAQPNVNFNVDSESPWPSIISNALPIVSNLMNKRQDLEEKDEVIKTNDTKYRTIEKGTIRPIGFIPEEVASDSTKSRGDSSEPRSVSTSEQQNSVSDSGVSKIV